MTQKNIKKERRVKAWAVVDTQKSYPRLCYAGKETTELYKNGLIAAFFIKPKIRFDKKWKDIKKISRITIIIHPK